MRYNQRRIPMILVFHIHRRYDEFEHQRYRAVLVKDKKMALETLFDLIGRYSTDQGDLSKEDMESHKQEILKSVTDKGVWIWEWERKGNGDFYKIIDFDASLDGEPPAFDFICDIENAYVIG